MEIKDLVLNHIKDHKETIEITEFTLKEITEVSFILEVLLQQILVIDDNEEIPVDYLRKLTDFNFGLRHEIEERLQVK
jgi:hypothetical protein